MQMYVVIRHKEDFLLFKNFPNVVSKVFVRFEKFQLNSMVPPFIPASDGAVPCRPIHSYSLLSTAARLDQMHSNFILVNLLSNPQKKPHERKEI